MAEIPDSAEGAPLNRLAALRDAGVRTGMDRYADYPTHFKGEPGPATPEAGALLLDAMAQHVVDTVRAIKADTETRRLQDEFSRTSESPVVPRPP